MSIKTSFSSQFHLDSLYVYFERRLRRSRNTIMISWNEWSIDSLHSARVAYSTSHSNVTLRGRPTLAHMKVFRTSFNVPDSVECNSYVRLGRGVYAKSFLRPRRIRTSGDLSYGPNVGHPLNLRGRLTEWAMIYSWMNNNSSFLWSLTSTFHSGVIK